MLVKPLAAALLAAPLLASAAAPKELTVTQSVDLKGTPEAVWNAVKDFDSLDKWHPGFSKDEIVKGENNHPGAVRRLTIKDGPSFTEQLTTWNGKAHSYTYRIVESPLPITGYRSTLSIKPGKDGMTTLTWSGHFKRKNAAANPPEGETDEAALKLVTGVYQGGLDNLKKQFGG